MGAARRGGKFAHRVQAGDRSPERPGRSSFGPFAACPASVASIRALCSAGHGIFERLRVLEIIAGSPLGGEPCLPPGIRAPRSRSWSSIAPAFLGHLRLRVVYRCSPSGACSTTVYDPAGYPLFIRVLHAIYPHLSLLILVQHGLGSREPRALIYLAVRRVTGSDAAGARPGRRSCCSTATRCGSSTRRSPRRYSRSS